MGYLWVIVDSGRVKKGRGYFTLELNTKKQLGTPKVGTLDVLLEVNFMPNCFVTNITRAKG